jgi:PAS domain S-box-containing protein
VIPIEDSAAPIKGTDDKVIGAVMVFHDVTEKRKAENALRASEERLRRFYESGLVGVTYWNMDGAIMEANDKFLEIVGYNREDLVAGKIDWMNMTPAEYRHLDERSVAELKTTGVNEVPFEKEYVRKDGTRVPIIMAGTMLDEARFNGVAFVLDITERKRMEEELRRSRDELELRVLERTESLRRQAGLLELAYSAIFVRDLEGRITFWNARAEEMYGWTKAEVGMVTDTLLKTQFPVPFDEYMAALTKEGRWEGELVRTTKEGRQITVLSRQALQRDEAGDPLAIMEIDLDVTEARRTEQQLRQAQKMEALGTLTGGIAHDFNNILAAMMGFTELAKGRAFKESRQEHHLQKVLDAGLRGRELIKQMLTFSRKTEQEKEPLQLSSVVKEAMNLLRASIPSTVSMRVHVDGEPGLVLADPTQMQQILMNLCTNAAHAMREKGGVLDVELSDFSPLENGNTDGMKPSPYMKLVVRDTGAGIPSEVVDKIFDPFFTTKKQGEGTGLGLSVVLGIVKQHDGHITVESEPGRGSTFTVYLPKVAEQPRVKTVGEESVPTGHERVLFIDDEETLTEMGHELLEELGYEVTVKNDSIEALALFMADPVRFDLVVTDQTMPEMTGIELARKLMAVRPDIPVILATGFSHAADATTAGAVGIRAFLMKPLTKGELARTVRKVLDG